MEQTLTDKAEEFYKDGYTPFEVVGRLALWACGYYNDREYTRKICRVIEAATAAGKDDKYV